MVPGKILVWNTETGEAREHWPVDARAMVTRWPEQYTTTDPEGGEGAKDGLDPKPLAGGAPKSVPREHSPGVPLNPTGAAEAKALELPKGLETGTVGKGSKKNGGKK